MDAQIKGWEEGDGRGRGEWEVKRVRCNKLGPAGPRVRQGSNVIPFRRFSRPD